jgi:hypothetical protein
MSSWPLPPPPVGPNKSNRNKIVLWISLAAVFFAIILLFLGKRTYHDYRLASAAMEQFHQQLNAANYDGIYTEASDDFRKSGNHDEMIRFLETVHEKMGDSGKTAMAGFHVNWRNGRLWVDEVSNTQFALGQGQESFIWILEQDHLQLYGYHITSPNLR